jgi:hypothetical protein
MTTKFWGRDPALFASFIATALKVVSALVLTLSPEQQSWINAVVAAVIGLAIAVKVRDGQVAAILGFAQALLSLAVGYGLALDDLQQSLIMSLIGTGMALFVRTQVIAPEPIKPPGSTPETARPQI